MGVCGVFCGCSGAIGFNGCCSGVSSGDGGFMLASISGCKGVIGFKAATWLCPVREFVRPAWPDGGREREQVRSAHEKWPKIGALWRVGRVFSRMGRWRAVVGEFCRGSAGGGPGMGEFCRGCWLEAIVPCGMCSVL